MQWCDCFFCSWCAIASFPMTGHGVPSHGDGSPVGPHGNTMVVPGQRRGVVTTRHGISSAFMTLQCIEALPRTALGSHGNTMIMPWSIMTLPGTHPNPVLWEVPCHCHATAIVCLVMAHPSVSKGTSAPWWDCDQYHMIIPGSR